MADKSTKTETLTSKTVDFSNVKDGGSSFNKKRVPAGDYLARITKVVDAESKKDGVHQWLYTIVLEGKFGDRKFPYYCKLQENQLWKLRNLFLAAGKAVPKKKVKVVPSIIVGKLIAITLEDDEYEGKAQSNIEAVFAASELDDTDTDDVDTDEDTEDDDEDTDDEESDDTDDEDDSDDDESEDEEEDEEDEEDEEPEPAPVKKKKAAAAAVPAPRKSAPAKKAAPAKKVAKKKPVTEVDEDDLEELDLESI